MRPLLLLGLLCSSLFAQTHTPTESANIEKVRRFYAEVWTKGNLAVADDTFAAEYVRHDLRPGQAIPGPEGQKKIAAGFHESFANVQMVPDFILADGDFVVARWRITATEKKTGKPLDFRGVNIFRFKDGKVVEIWNHRDDLGFREQMAGIETAKPHADPEPKPKDHP
jgi:predicted SnoaL-like aldol condensation-catalyzing enzyme